MAGFKEFLESNEGDARDTIRDLPPSHRRLVRGYAFHFQPNGTLKGDGDHIGKVEGVPTKRITLAAPWHYPRSFTLIHEIGHLVWARFVKGTKLETEWMKLYKRTSGKIRQNAEECFSHSYANYYSHNKIMKHHHEEFEKFIRSLPK